MYIIRRADNYFIKRSAAEMPRKYLIEPKVLLSNESQPKR
jgi:hypothetical protein